MRLHILLIFMVHLFVGTISAAQVLVVSAQTDQALEVYKINAKSGLPSLDHQLKMPGRCGELALSPDGSKIYVALSYSGKNLDYRHGIATVSFDASGKLKLLHTEPKAISSSHLACDPSGKYLITASYGEGKVTMLPIQDGICKGPVIEQRSTDDNAHCVAISKDGRYAFVPHTGPNAVYQFRINSEKNRLDANKPAFVEGPPGGNYNHEPRHIRFHPKANVAYTSNERGGGISLWKYDPFWGQLTLAQTESTTDHPDDMQTYFASADCQIAPNGRFVYITNRDNRDRKSPEGLDSITGFEINTRNGRIVKRIGIYPTGRHPRVMIIHPNGKFLYCAGRNSSDLTSYSIESDGSLKTLKKISVGQGPMGLLCITPVLPK